jgi:hypothetical protein
MSNELNESGETSVVNKVLAGVVAAAVIAGGVILVMNDEDGVSEENTKPVSSEMLSYDEAQVLIPIYNNELKKAKDKEFTKVKEETIIESLNNKFSKRDSDVAESVMGETLTKDEYNLLRSKLMEKSENVIMEPKIEPIGEVSAEN